MQVSDYFFFPKVIIKADEQDTVKNDAAFKGSQNYY